jgi:hypothetical protein
MIIEWLVFVQSAIGLERNMASRGDLCRMDSRGRKRAETRVYQPRKCQGTSIWADVWEAWSESRVRVPFQRVIERVNVEQRDIVGQP